MAKVFDVLPEAEKAKVLREIKAQRLEEEGHVFGCAVYRDRECDCGAREEYLNRLHWKGE